MIDEVNSRIQSEIEGIRAYVDGAFCPLDLFTKESHSKGQELNKINQHSISYTQSLSTVADEIEKIRKELGFKLDSR